MNQEEESQLFGESHFHKVIPFQEEKPLEWEELSRDIPALPRGWYELSRLPLEDRVEFTREYWFSKLPFTAVNGIQLEEQLNYFFNNLANLEIYATQSSSGSPFDVHMIYSQKGETGFFHGSPPASPQAIKILIKQFAHVTLPADYLAFLQIHDGFCKYTDRGIIKSSLVSRTYAQFQELLKQYQQLVEPESSRAVNPASLIPFYESHELHCYQCFYADWYPDQEMGNVAYSLLDHALSDFLDQRHLVENMAFPSFLEWLFFYLEDFLGL